jgi:hypothetical protein
MQSNLCIFIALVAIPIVQVAFAPRLAPAGSSNILLADGRQLRTRETGDPMSPRSQQRPKAS